MEDEKLVAPRPSRVSCTERTSRTEGDSVLLVVVQHQDQSGADKGIARDLSSADSYRCQFFERVWALFRDWED